MLPGRSGGGTTRLSLSSLATTMRSLVRRAEARANPFPPKTPWPPPAAVGDVDPRRLQPGDRSGKFEGGAAIDDRGDSLGRQRTLDPGVDQLGVVEPDPDVRRGDVVRRPGDGDAVRGSGSDPEAGDAVQDGDARRRRRDCPLDQL